MNDTELDELLDTWKTPSPPAGLRARLQDAAARESEVPRLQKRKFFGGWKMLLASAATACNTVCPVRKLLPKSPSST